MGSSAGMALKRLPIIPASLKSEVRNFGVSGNDFFEGCGRAWIVQEMKSVLDRSGLIEWVPFESNFSQFGSHDESPARRCSNREACEPSKGLVDW